MAPDTVDTTSADSASDGTRIVTLTMNPALDITTNTEIVIPTEKMRCGAARYDPGGGGINVARVAQTLGAAVTSVFPAGGASGDLITDMMTASGLPLRRIRIAEPTRESFTVNERRTQRQYRFVLPGPTLSAAEQEECLSQLRSIVLHADYVVASGSLPPNVTPDFYNRVADSCAKWDCRLIIDTSGSSLRHLTGARVFLLKPSVRELRECVGRELSGEIEQVAAARELIERDSAHNVLVTLGSRGALLVTTAGAQRFPAVTVPPPVAVSALAMP